MYETIQQYNAALNQALHTNDQLLHVLRGICEIFSGPLNKHYPELAAQAKRLLDSNRED